MRVVVTTPTGNVGSQLVPALLRAGLRPTVLARDPARLHPSWRGLVEARRVDQRDGDAVLAATRDADALFWVDPPSTEADPVAAYVRAGENAARAVSDNRIRRTVFLSSVGAERREGAGEIDGLARTEQLLDATGASVTHLRCGFFMSNLELMIDEVRGGVVHVVLPVEQPLAWVAPRDIAEVAAGRLLGDWEGRHVRAVHGPADLSWEQATAIVAEATGHPLRAERIPDAQMRDALLGSGMGEGLADAVLGMSTGLRDGFVPEQPRDVTTTTPTTLAAWAYDVLRPQL